MTWDAAHILNLGVSDVKDSKSPSGIFFQTFLKRCNVFNTILANGKGFAFLQLVDETGRRPVAYAGQRFASSSYEQWRKIEQSYGSFWKAFEALYPNRNEEEELQYMKSGMGMDLDPRLAFRYMARIKEVVKVGIWKSLCPSWFMVQGTDEPLKPQDASLVLFEPVPSNTLDAVFKMKFASGKEYNARLHEQNVFSSFYSQEVIYSIAQPQSCAVLDIVLAKGGPEAIAESYFSCMRAQQQPGGQSNETLSRRTKLNWCLPSLKKM